MTEQPPIQPTPVGALRFNTDIAQLEYFNGNQYVNITTDSPEQHTGGVRGLFFGGRTPSDVDTIDYINISTTGNAIDFGNRLAAARQAGGTASRSRGVAVGRSGGNDTIEFVTIASTGNAQDFGNSTAARGGSPMAVSDGVRGIFAGGDPGTITNLIDYITIAQTGNAVDFGDLILGQSDGGRAQSPTRGIIAGGRTSPDSTKVNVIEFITMASTGNGADFGDLIQGRNEIAADSNAVRGIFAGGNDGGAVPRIEYVTIATLGNSIDFGDIATASTESRGSASPTRFAFAHGVESGYVSNISFVEIATTGASVHFGSLTQSRGQAAGFSNGHGGLG